MSPERVADLAMGWFNESKNGGQHGWMDMINKLKSKNFDPS